MSDADVSMKVGMTDELALELKMAREMKRIDRLVTLAGHVWAEYFAKYGEDTAPDDVVSDAEDILAAIERLEAGHE